MSGFPYTTEVPEFFGLLGAGAQAREIETFAHPDRVAFRAVDAKFAGAEGTIDIGTHDEEFLRTPVAAAVGAPGLRRSLVERWGGATYRRVTASGSWIAESAVLGEGVMVAPMAAVSAAAVLGDHVLVNIAATVSHDTRVGAYATLSPGVHVAGHCRIGAGVFLGIGASVVDGVSIADGCVVGAGSTVISDIEESGVYVGVPARLVRTTKEWLDAL